MKQANKEFKIQNKEQYRLSRKIENLENVKNLKQIINDVMNEHRKS